jgi:hypothetical protein
MHIHIPVEVCHEMIVIWEAAQNTLSTVVGNQMVR